MRHFKFKLVDTEERHETVAIFCKEYDAGILAEHLEQMNEQMHQHGKAEREEPRFQIKPIDWKKPEEGA